MRGCFLFGISPSGFNAVFPAHAGVFLGHALRRDWAPSLPRACGGVSVNGVHGGCPLASSPRMRGCFLRSLWRKDSRPVFPAHAGVFPRRTTPPPPPCLPRACGGVSIAKAPKAAKPVSSPRMRGCFPRQRGSGRRKGVFPAHAGVFPKLIVRIVGYACLPRACGGVSSSGKQVVGHKLSSPRMRGCFSSKLLDCNAVRVFPAHAGVFPRSGVMSRRMLSLPRACGGVSN